jgi:hypothetical protein
LEWGAHILHFDPSLGCYFVRARARAYSYLVGRSVLLEPQFDVSKFSRDRQRLLNASTADGQLSDRHINTDLKNRLRDIETDCRNCFHV